MKYTENVSLPITISSHAYGRFATSIDNRCRRLCRVEGQKSYKRSHSWRRFLHRSCLVHLCRALGCYSLPRQSAALSNAISLLVMDIPPSAGDILLSSQAETIC